MSDVPIPLVDLSIQFHEIWDDFQSDFAKLCESGGFIGGSIVSEFESQFAQFMQVKHCVGVGNGGDAIELALRAINVSHGDEVLIPANTFIATATAVSRVGAIPIPIDVSETDFLIDVSKIEEQISTRTKAVIPVHLFGQMANMEAITEIAHRHGLSVIEDAAQSHGATRNGLSCGSLGIAAATSFYPGKNLGAFGDGGAVITNDSKLENQIRKLRNYGGINKYEHDVIGFNTRLDSIQALVLSHKLKHLERWNEQRATAAETYRRYLEDTPGVILPEINEGNTHVWHLYVIRIQNRDGILNTLTKQGIGVGIHYPKPFSELPAYSHILKSKNNCQVTSQLSKEILSLPIYPGIADQQIRRVCSALKQSLDS